MKRTTLLAWLASSSLLLAGAAEDWKEIQALDSGPRKKPATAAEGREAALRHLALQRSSLEEFLEKYPRDPKAWEARLRLASVLATLGMTGPDPRQVRAAKELFTDVAQNPAAPAALRADAAFRKASLIMQEADSASPKGREAIVAAARAFHRSHPGDIRGPRMLVEAATICDADPALKRELLEEARADTSEAPLLARIADDLRRLELLGKPLDLRLPSLGGAGELDLAAMRGRPVVLVFWSSESPHSLLWLRDFRAAWEAAPRRPLVAAVSLDTRRQNAIERAKAFPTQWRTGFEPGGWESPTARRLGINALPTVWVLDAEGRLRSLNARGDWQSWVGRLAR